MLFIACFITIRGKEREKQKFFFCFGNSNHRMIFSSRVHKIFYNGVSCNWRDCLSCNVPCRSKRGNICCHPYSRLLRLCIFRMIGHNRCSYTPDSSYIHSSPSIHCNTLHGLRIYFCIPCTRPGSSSTSNRDWLDIRPVWPRLHSTLKYEKYWAYKV